MTYNRAAARANKRFHKRQAVPAKQGGTRLVRSGTTTRRVKVVPASRGLNGACAQQVRFVLDQEGITGAAQQAAWTRKVEARLRKKGAPLTDPKQAVAMILALLTGAKERRVQRIENENARIRLILAENEEQRLAAEKAGKTPPPALTYEDAERIVGARAARIAVPKTAPIQERRKPGVRERARLAAKAAQEEAERKARENNKALPLPSEGPAATEPTL